MDAMTTDPSFPCAISPSPFARASARRWRSTASRFDIKKGETVALVGESGSGKSVTALSVLKLLPYPAAHHPSGSIRFKGQELLGAARADIRRVRGNDITIIFQEPMTSLNPLHTIEKQIGEILLLHRGLTGEAARAAHSRAAQPGRHPRSADPSAAAIRISSPAASASV